MSLISLPAFLSRRREEPAEVPDVPEPSAAVEPIIEPDDNVLARFRTQGGAVVELCATTFVTRWASCPPFAAPKPYNTHGFQWSCHGCGAYGREGDDYNDPCYRKLAEARGEANGHADACRALPKP